MAFTRFELVLIGYNSAERMYSVIMEKFLLRLLHSQFPVCPVSSGLEGPYEYVQFIKNESVVFETPKVCLEFLKIDEFTPRLYVRNPERALWINRDELKLIHAHKHTFSWPRLDCETSR